MSLDAEKLFSTGSDKGRDSFQRLISERENEINVTKYFYDYQKITLTI